MVNTKKILGDRVEYAPSMIEAVKDADVLAVLTEWEEFGGVDLAELKKLMRNSKIVDLRNMLKTKNPLDEGFRYFCIGAN
jgi:UDPglucose 6-dehydrogenase